MEVQNSLVREVHKCMKVLRKLYAPEDDDEQMTEGACGGPKSQPFPEEFKYVKKVLENTLAWTEKAQDIFLLDVRRSIGPIVLEQPTEQRIADSYIKMELAEKGVIEELRAHNVMKLTTGINGTYCICRSPVKGEAHKCTLCHGWFHGTCIVLTPINESYLCPYCRTTKGPTGAFLFPLLIKDPMMQLPNGQYLVRSADKALRFQEVFKLIIRVGEVRQMAVRLVKIKARGPIMLEEDVGVLVLEGLLLELQLNYVDELWKIWMAVVGDGASGSSIKEVKEMKDEKPELDACSACSNMKEVKDEKPELDACYGCSSMEEVKDEKPELDTCSAKICREPDDDLIDWIQCDGSCDKWFHMTCVDLKREEVGKNDMFFCLDCRMTMEGLKKKVSKFRHGQS